MPFGPYADFESCQKDQMKKHKGEKGFTKENASAICGFLKHKLEK